MCGAGLVSAGVGVIGVDISLEAIGILMGVAGYALGARVTGVLTTVISTAMLVLVIGLGEFPEPMTPTDPLANPGG